MTPADVARNAKAVRNLAARLERLNFEGDCHTEAELIAMNLAADGWRPLDKPEPEPAPTGRGSTEHARRQALIAAEQAVRAAKEARKHPLRETK